ncbi:MAG: twin-arginine translocase subunit TatB [Gammaproteobacteria bacterium]|nr:twin-arginine translocase subunit TatB [Gammaproteobacteria bacterium]
MFDIGFPELVMVAVIALLVIGPDKLPGVARTAGKWVGRARRFVGDVKTDIDRELKQEELKKALAEDAGLDEIKQIMNTDNFTIDAEEAVSDYQVKAMSDDNDDEESYDSQLDDDDYDLEKDEELKHITDHSDGAVVDVDDTSDKETPSKKA